MKTSFIRITSQVKFQLLAVLISAGLCGLGCANIGRKIDQAVAPILTPAQTPAETKVASSAANAPTADSSINKAVAQEKFDKMLQENGLTK
jgi:hypothetical protein